MAARFRKASNLSMHDAIQYFGLEFKTYITSPNLKFKHYKDQLWPSNL